MKYIHFGSNKFDIEKFKLIKNEPYRNKPSGGLWASPIGAAMGWKEWCENENFRECKEDNSFRFNVLDKANIYQINSVSDCMNMPLVKTEYDIKIMLIPDFEEMYKSGIDAIQFNLSNDHELYFTLYGWDCDSILIMNKNVIELISE